MSVEKYSESSQTSEMEHFCKNNQRVLVADYFREEAPS